MAIYLKNYPLKFDNTALDFWPEWGRDNNPIKNTMQSEGGRDMVQVIRARKLSIPFSCAVADDTWVAFFEEYSEKESFSLSIYSPQTHAYETITCQITGFSCKPRKKSELLDAVHGVWDVSFTIEEL